MRASRLRHEVVWLGCVALLLSGCATKIAHMESPRTPDVPPAPAIAGAVAEYKARDPDASFTFVGGHVDGFATSAKPRVPDYALPVLSEVGLPTADRPVTKLLTPMQAPTRSRDLDASDRALPFVSEDATPRYGGDGHAGHERMRDRTAGHHPSRRAPRAHPTPTAWSSGRVRMAERWRSSSGPQFRS